MAFKMFASCRHQLQKVWLFVLRPKNAGSIPLSAQIAVLLLERSFNTLVQTAINYYIRPLYLSVPHVSKISQLGRLKSFKIPILLSFHALSHNITFLSFAVGLCGISSLLALLAFTLYYSAVGNFSFLKSM